MKDVEYEVVEVDLTASQAQAQAFAEMPKVEMVAKTDAPVPVGNPVFREKYLTRTPAQKSASAERRMKKMWELFLAEFEKRKAAGLPCNFQEIEVRKQIERQVLSDFIQSGDFCPRCMKFTMALKPCGGKDCREGEFRPNYFCCNIKGCKHYMPLIDAQPDGTRLCFEHRLAIA